MEDFSVILRTLMSIQGLNQVSLSKKSGVSQALISSYLRKGSKAKYPSLKNLIKIAKVVGCSLDELVGISKPPHDIDSIAKLRPSPDQLALWQAYANLPEGHWMRFMVEQELLRKKLSIE